MFLSTALLFTGENCSRSRLSPWGKLLKREEAFFRLEEPRADRSRAVGWAIVEAFYAVLRHRRSFIALLAFLCGLFSPFFYALAWLNPLWYCDSTPDGWSPTTYRLALPFCTIFLPFSSWSFCVFLLLSWNTTRSIFDAFIKSTGLNFDWKSKVSVEANPSFSLELLL